MVEVKNVGQMSFSLGENARWNPFDRRFYFCDINSGRIYSSDTSGGKTVLELDTGYLLGAFLFTRSNDIILFTEKGLAKAKRLDSSYHFDGRILLEFDFEEGERFNDAIADPCGRIITGSKKTDNRDGRLYSISKDGSVRILLENLKISNGMGFSKDGTVFYHTDSGNRTIMRYRYDISSGLLSHPEVFFTDFPECGEPDGMSVDACGNVWTACWGAGCIIGISPEAKVIGHISVPAKNVSSVAFGGKNFESMFITSSTCFLEEIAEYDGRCYYMEKCPAIGKPEYLV